MAVTLKSINDWADFWRYEIGVNVIPANTRKKETYESWKKWQDKPSPAEIYDEWKASGAFNNGIAIILGKVWHNPLKTGLYLTGVDLDNQKAIEEICNREGKAISLSQLAQWTLVEQHADDCSKAHVLFYSHKSSPKKSSDSNGQVSKIDSNEIPAIEVKGLGSHGILFVTPSVHQNGQPYQIIGTRDPVIADDFINHIDNICRKYSIPYLDGVADNGNGKAQLPIQDLFKSDFTIFEGHNRHEALMRVMESLISRNSSILSLEEIKPLTKQWNNQHCNPPLNDHEFEKQWICATDFIVKNTNNNSINQKQKEKEDDEDAELASNKLTKEDIDFAINTMIKEARYDELSIRQIIHGFNSTFTKLPIPHVINSKNSGAGKSYILNHVAQFYPEKYILTLAGLTDKAIFHSDGTMVVDDEHTGEVNLLDPIINDLESQIEQLREQDSRANRKQIKEIESEIKSLQRSAQKLIDLNNKIIILQDTPQQIVFNLLMTLLSQDSPKDQIYAFTDKSSGNGKFIQSRNRIRGMPVIFTTQVLDDTDNQRFEEKNRRFIHVTPNTSKEKIREANRLTARKYGYLPDEYDELVVRREDIEKAKRIVRIIVAKIKQHTSLLQSKSTGVKIPFAMTIAESLPDDGGVWQMTVGERLMKYLSMNTKLHMDRRPRLVHKETGAFYPISTFEDLKDTMALMERAATNMRPYLADWYDRVFLEAFKELDGEPKVIENDIGISYMQENHVGLTTEQLAIKTKVIMEVRKPSTDEIRESYLDPLVNLGLIEKTSSVKDNRQNIYFPVEYSRNGNVDTNRINKIKVKDPDLYPTKHLIEESFRTLVKYPARDAIFFDQITNYWIEDVDGRKIELEELVNEYFNNPEQYFQKEFTQEDEERAELRKKIFFTCRQRVILQAFSKNINEQSTCEDGNEGKSWEK